MSAPTPGREENLRHIAQVRLRLDRAAADLTRRGQVHDASKLVPPEADAFEIVTARLRGLAYGSPEYEASRHSPELKAALEHHYSANDHHPEHFGKAGIRGMNLIQALEMACDWHASCLRHDTGDPHESVEVNQKRFGYSDDFKAILHNTVDWLDGKSPPLDLTPAGGVS